MKDIEHNCEAAAEIVAKFDSDLLAYIPQAYFVRSHKGQRGEFGVTHKTSASCEPPDEMVTLAINSAIRQVSAYVKAEKFQKIGISGSGGEEVARVVMDIARIRQNCSVVLRISVCGHDRDKEVKQKITEQILVLQQIGHIFSLSLDQLLPHNFFLVVECVDEQMDLHDLRLPDHGVVVLTTRSQVVYKIMDVDVEVRMEDICYRGTYSKLSSHSSAMEEGSSQVMKHVLELVWDQKDLTTKYCLQYRTSRWKQRKVSDSPVSEWISSYLVETKEEAEGILKALISSFLLEDASRRVFMRKETKVVLNEYFTSYLPSLSIRRGGFGLTKTPTVEKYTKEIELHDNELSELPENPKWPALRKLWLQNNYNLMQVPELFFEDMPLLVCLDLSHTNIKSLPPSISRLVSLQRFYLRGCELLNVLPPHIGALRKLEVFDLEGTEIMYFPREIGELISLRCFKVSLCGHANYYGETKQTGIAIPTEVFSLFPQLEELSIDVSPDGEYDDVNPDSEWWDAELKAILNALSMPSGIIEALKHASLLFLDRHWTVKVLSEFGHENLADVECCLLVECNELQTIVDGDYECPSGGDNKPILQWLRHLSIHYMKNLESIWRGSIHQHSLSRLISLTFNTCPNLTTIFTPDMLGNLFRLSELIVEDCPKICSVVTEADANVSGHFCRSLWKIALLDLPQLVTISGPLCLGEEVDSLFVYSCPMLESLDTAETSPKYCKIIGEKEWWDSLKWHDSKWSRMTQPAFEELRTDEDFTDQLVRDIYSPMDFDFDKLEIGASNHNSEAAGFVHRRPPRVVLATHGRRCRPTAGGAPFVTCYNCHKLLQLPEKFLLMDINQKKVRCGGCSTVILFAIIDKKLVSVCTESERTPKLVDDSPKAIVIGGTSHSRVHANQARTKFSSDDYDDSSYDYDDSSYDIFSSVDYDDSSYDTFSSVDYDDSSYDFEAMDREVISSSMRKHLSSNRSGEMGRIHSTSPYCSEDKGKIDTMSAKVESNSVTSPQNSMEEVSLETEMDVSLNEYSNTGTFQESGDISREDQLRANKGNQSFFEGISKESFKDSSQSNLTIEQSSTRVTINGNLMSDCLLKKAVKLSGPIHPGHYWYDSRAGFWGVMGGPCLGIIPPCIEEFDYPMPGNCAGGNTGVFVNGRELHQKDLNLLSTRGLPTTKDRSYIVEISGRVLDGDSGEEVDRLGKLAPTIEKVKHGFGMKVPRVE
ncbi:hypothetical protein RHMOL_Rhmol11G0182500 [Rhododendron molle]|uniref:Uncharacterized protein n=1 Tax=Rhododendron molle TaxID=49168 RepID=A0ACC0LTY2_RHOML|nr:hypothetical protein RHMOL_Rhmol11G0182500 [Rhododendron molle]